MKNKLISYMTIFLFTIAALSCSNQDEELLKLEDGLYIQVSLEDAFNSLEVYPPKADFDAEITLVRSDGVAAALNYPLAMRYQNGRYVSRSIPIPAADYRLTKFTVHRLEKAQLITAPDFAVTYPINSSETYAFRKAAGEQTLLTVRCLSLSYMETHTKTSESQAQAAEASGFYLFINRCNAGNREKYHEVLAYSYTAYLADSGQNQGATLASGNNLDSSEQPEPIYIPLPADYTYGIILEVKPIGEDSFVVIPVSKEEIDKYVNGEMDYVHLEIGCDS
jgi:hypothetical protein